MPADEGRVVGAHARGVPRGEEDRAKARGGAGVKGGEREGGGGVRARGGGGGVRARVASGGQAVEAAGRGARPPSLLRPARAHLHEQIAAPGGGGAGGGGSSRARVARDGGRGGRGGAGSARAARDARVAETPAARGDKMSAEVPSGVARVRRAARRARGDAKRGEARRDAHRATGGGAVGRREGGVRGARARSDAGASAEVTRRRRRAALDWRELIFRAGNY